MLHHMPGDIARRRFTADDISAWDAPASFPRTTVELRLGDFSEPESDLALVRWRDGFYGTAHPGSADILLVVEMADSSLRYDLQAKAPLCSPASIRR